MQPCWTSNQWIVSEWMDSNSIFTWDEATRTTFTPSLLTSHKKALGNVLMLYLRNNPWDTLVYRNCDASYNAVTFRSIKWLFRIIEFGLSLAKTSFVTKTKRSCIIEYPYVGMLFHFLSGGLLVFFFFCVCVHQYLLRQQPHCMRVWMCVENSELIRSFIACGFDKYHHFEQLEQK